MGIEKKKRLVILISLFIIPCLFGFIESDQPVVKKDRSLAECFKNINAYRIVEMVPLEKNIYQFLKLDDYIFSVYQQGESRIYLYIGFYYTADKVSAAHSPLSCFPGQGWVITKPRYKSQLLNEHLIRFAQIEATLGSKKEYVVYWYQSNDDTTPYAYVNKINTFYNKIVNGDPQHSFVRISTPMTDISPEIAEMRIVDFLNEFYPIYLNFIMSDGQRN